MKTTQDTYVVGIYCRLSRDDEQPGESISISTQRAILMEYCTEHNFIVYDTYVDDGASGLNFNRKGFQRLLRDIECNKVNMVLTKDLSRLGRDYIQMGYYTEIYFPTKNVRYIALSDGYDSNKETNDVAPFMNILNDMYAKDISRKVKAAKLQRAKNGLFVGGVPPYGYTVYMNHLVIDPIAAKVVQTIFELALSGLGASAIAQTLEKACIPRPNAYRSLDKTCQFLDACVWRTSTVSAILSNRVYLGELLSHKTGTVNYKTKERRTVPQAQQIIILNAHEPIITEEQYLAVQQIRSTKLCPAHLHRENIFRGMLFCSECGHPLSIAHRRLKYREDDLYRCMHHFQKPDECRKTHAIYHESLCQFVLSELKCLARSMRRRNVQSRIVDYCEISELKPEILQMTVNRIEIGHLNRRTPLKKAVKINWKLS